MKEDHDSRDAHFIVAIASSAGGIRGLTVLLGGLDESLPVAVLVVQHLDPHHRTVLAEILGRRTSLPVKLAGAGERVRPGHIYIAPPGRHLLAAPRDRIRLSGADAVNFVRPSADLLFRSVAEQYGERVIACVLTGTGRDGASGADAVKAAGGKLIVQDPDSAEFTGMPEAAVSTGRADFVLPLEDIPAAIRGLVEAKRQP
ncbi:chemotaxis protein CheB [Streptomyces tsukubensis]|uniref:protein-glutamate methylesterase n=1 Tax=Streptomyces tsukubensis TaxID=83656 RepID=A0A1V4A7X8_9ACTN|nr:chemotaxis protein CheB [Streptomyces tsukubensis]OON78776.1 chemotaxis protein CheB [Streptomyces tsukubensis]QFR94255.1 chemotaxis protein CheB [Streptomyces tsukubensis]